MRRRVLLVEPDAADAASLLRAVALLADVDACTDFLAARKQLLGSGYDLLVTNLRLRAYNGLHLVYLARADRPATSSIVYTDRRDLALAREVQHAGAFYESRDRLPYVLQAYFAASLPPVDRRNPAFADRRHSFRGGRRSSDVAVLAIRSVPRN